MQKRIQLTQFKSVIIIVMWKSDKKNYFNAKIYKSIVLLDTLSKILKFIIFERLQNIIQMRIYKQKLTDTTLQLITEKIHIVWSDIRRKVISLLSLNEKSAFNNVVHSKLLHDIKKEEFSDCFSNLWRTFWEIDASWSQSMITWWWNATWMLTYHKILCYH